MSRRRSAPPTVPRCRGSPTPRCSLKVTDRLALGLDAPICLTWELTYGCNLACVHCLSSSGRRDPRELTTAELFAVVDELRAMQVFYVNIGGGEPTLRPDFWELLDYCVDNAGGGKVSTNGSRITDPPPPRVPPRGYVHRAISRDRGAAAPHHAGRRPGAF